MGTFGLKLLATTDQVHSFKEQFKYNIVGSVDHQLDNGQPHRPVLTQLDLCWTWTRWTRKVWVNPKHITTTKKHGRKGCQKSCFLLMW